jgi:hypothetical protein
MADRLIDALSWYGDASFEPSPGAKLAKLAMALERLTMTTRRFSKKRFCRYVAILALDDDADFESKYWTAYDFYNARSSVSHGCESQFEVNHWKRLRDAEAMIVNCIFRGTEVYSIVKSKSAAGPRSLRDFFAQQENRWVETWKKLDDEMKERDAEGQNAGLFAAPNDETV